MDSVLRISGPTIAQFVMIWGCRIFPRKVEDIGIVIHLLERYIDDINLVVESVEKGIEFKNGKLERNNAKEEEDEKSSR